MLPLLAAGSKNLSTFVSAKERVLSWRQQLLETGVVGILDLGQKWVWLKWYYCTNPLPSQSCAGCRPESAVSNRMVEHQASYRITASRTRSVKESNCWSRRGEFVLSSPWKWWETRFGYNLKSTDSISKVLMQFGTKYCQEYSFSQTAFKDLGCFKGLWAWQHTSPGQRLFLLLALPSAGHFLEYGCGLFVWGLRGL